MRYRPNTPIVLNGISFNIKSQEKIGVIGRTGSGKSSMCICLFRIVEVESGSILIDDVDISKISLKTLRQRLSFIPQDPVIFSGTLRDNLDPFHIYEEDQLLKVLQMTQLNQKFENEDQILMKDIKEFGSNLSVGERQLICIGRAILKKSKILVMDEATAAIDFKTDQIIQEIVRDIFKDKTVITIAHRINTIQEYDRIIEMSQGQILHIDTPGALAKNPLSLMNSNIQKINT